MSRSDFAGTELTGSSGPYRIVSRAALLLVVAACQIGDSVEGPVASREWGPLAIAESASGDRARITGTIQITERCVLLDRGNEAALLVWPSTHTSWDSEDMTVEFVSRSGQRTLLHDGDRAVFAGGGSSEAEDGQSTDEFLASIAWTAQPDRECVTDIRWFVSDIVVEDPG